MKYLYGDELVHKRRGRVDMDSDNRSLCGQYGFVSVQWKYVNCPTCLGKRPKERVRK